MNIIKKFKHFWKSKKKLSDDFDKQWVDSVNRKSLLGGNSKIYSALGKKCILCGREMLQNNLGVDCKKGHDLLCYDALQDSYYTNSKNVAIKCQELGYYVNHTGTYYDIRTA